MRVNDADATTTHADARLRSTREISLYSTRALKSNAHARTRDGEYSQININHG